MSAKMGGGLAIGLLTATVAVVALGMTGRPPAPRAAQVVPQKVKAAVKPRPGPAKPAQHAAYTIKRILPIAGPMHHGDNYWDEAGVPDGPIVVTVDLAAQVLSVFRGGYEIGTAVILYGADAKPTPLGVYPVTQKDATHRSSIYGGAPMPYMLRLTNDGVSIHGSDVKDGYMTHGCIGVPIAFAKKLFGVVKVGDKVIVTRGETLDIGKAVTAI